MSSNNFLSTEFWSQYKEMTATIRAVAEEQFASYCDWQNIDPGLYDLEEVSDEEGYILFRTRRSYCGEHDYIDIPIEALFNTEWLNEKKAEQAKIEAEAAAAEAERKRKAKEEEAKWERDTYNRLKKKFEKGGKTK